MFALTQWRAVNDDPAKITALNLHASTDVRRAMRALDDRLPQDLHVADLRRHRRAVATFTHDLSARFPADQKMPTDASAALDGALALVNLFDEEIASREGEESPMRSGRSTGEFVDAATGRPLPHASAAYGPIRDQLATHMRDPHAGADITVGDFFRGVAGLRTTEAVRAAMSGGTDSAGGYALPQYVQLQILEAMVPASSLLTAGAGIVDLTEGAKSHRMAAVNAIPTAAWRSEGGAIAESDPTFRNIDLVARSLAFRFKVSRELLMDVSNLDATLSTVIAQAFAKELDRAGLRGTGTAPEIRGLLNTSGVQSVTNGAAGTSLGTIKWSNLMTATQSILAADAPAPSAAIMSPRSLIGFGNLTDTTGQPLMRPGTIDNLRFIATSQIPNSLTVGAATDCTEMYIGDFSRMAFFFRERMSIQRLVEAHATTGEIGFVGHVRVDLGVMYPAAFAVVTGVRP
jgi:HK97 family phage major capsid protein